MLRLESLCATYDKEEILHGIDLDIQPHQVTIILGPNGSGKSTLLKSMISSSVKVTGNITYNNENLLTLSSQELAKRIAYLPQGKHVPDIQVGRMVLHGRFPYLNYPRHYKANDYKKADEALKKVGIETLRDKNVKELSGGNQQKVYIAMALAQDSPIILLDEPTTYLDIAYQIKLLELVKTLAKEGKTVVMVLHDIAQALKYGDHLVLLKDGKMVGQGSPEEMYKNKMIDRVFEVKLGRYEINQHVHYFIE